MHGTSIFVPTKSWTETVQIPAGQYSFTYEDDVDTVIQAPLNSGMFRGYQALSVMFLGANISYDLKNPDYVQASFDFAWQPNRSSANGNTLTIGPISGISKNAWDYLWVFYKSAEDTIAHDMKPHVKNVYVERVYDPSDFSLLNIGTGETLPMWQG